MNDFQRPNQLLAHSWHKPKISDIFPLEKGRKTSKPSAGLEPRKSMNGCNREGFYTKKVTISDDFSVCSLSWA